MGSANPPTPVTNTILFYVNGNRREIPDPDVDMTLLKYLRQVERLTGTKGACEEGGCGSCTVMLSSYEPSFTGGKIQYRAVNSCLFPICAADGMAITTVEGVGNRKGGLHPVQSRLASFHASQCGFCTPGFVMSCYALLRQKASDGELLTKMQVENSLDGNLCRCTGYRPILDAYKTFATDTGCCQRRGGDGGGCPCQEGDGDLEKDSKEPISELVSAQILEENALELNSEPIFPAELILRAATFLAIRNRWFRPLTLMDMFTLKAKYPDSKVIVGNTELGIDAKMKGVRFSSLICPSKVRELTDITSSDIGLIVGAAATLTALRGKIGICKNERPDFQTRSLQAISEQLQWFAGTQIRNTCSVGGNIATASPISDLNPIWIAAEALFMIANVQTGVRRLVKARDFFLGYRKVDLSDLELLLHIIVPWNTSKYDFIYAFKTSRRKDDDIAIVSAGIRLEVRPSTESGEWKWGRVSIGLGGMGPKTFGASGVEEYLENSVISRETLENSLDVLHRLYVLPKVVPGGMPEYRMSLALGFLFKAEIQAVNDLAKVLENEECQFQPPILGTPRETRGFYEGKMHLSRGVQVYSESRNADPSNHIGKVLKHLSGDLQVSGEAIYVDDMPKQQGELSAAFVLSKVPHGKILSIDTSIAQDIPGFVSTVFVQDVKGSNDIGPVVLDEKCFAESLVTCVGQVIGLVLGETLESAQKAANAVKVEYEELPAIVTIEEAIASSSYAPNQKMHRIQKGNVDSALAKGKIVSGEARIGFQEHFYFEPQSTLVVPCENDEMTIYASTQSPSKTQAMVARVLGVPSSRINVRVRRCGGAFGGKETKNVPLAAALSVAAQKMSRPIRLCLDRVTDMAITGAREAFYAKYRCAHDSSGRIKALDVEMFLNMGNSLDLSMSVLDRALYHANNCYDVPNIRFRGLSCYTHAPSSTAMRSFGANQSMMVCETIVEHVAHNCNISSDKIRSLNLFGKGGNSSSTPYGMDFCSVPLVKCWDAVYLTSEFEKRSLRVKSFNQNHRYKKRGIAIVPTMFGISFTFRTLNQAGCLVQIYHDDGSVGLSTGGIEMGQGLNTKLTMVAASTLGVKLERILVMETATDKVPNSSPSAASSCSDMYGMAVLDACKQLNDRLAPIKKLLGSGATWEEIVHTAWFERVNLSAQGFYKTPLLDALDLTDENQSKGRPFFYFTSGASVAEVEIDCITGEHRVLRSDIQMDVGRSLNPAIDIGQIEGAYVQGLGWCTLEEIVRGSSTSHPWLKNGHMHTVGPSTYKIPSCHSIPLDFRVTLLENGPNDQETIGGSRAIGEPPLFLASAVFFAIRQAIGEARKDCGQDGWFELDSPASVERIRSLCSDHITSRCMREGFRPDLTL